MNFALPRAFFKMLRFSISIIIWGIAFAAITCEFFILSSDIALSSVAIAFGNSPCKYISPVSTGRARNTRSISLKLLVLRLRHALGRHRLIGGVMRAIRMRELERDNREMSDRFLAGTVQHPEAFSSIISADRGMQTIFAYVEAVAKSPQPLLITGESGVGKELLARAAHTLSDCKGPLVSVNVAGLDDTVFADTLFGHLRGAFTGADQPRKGMIEEATDGTLFLDEIGDLSIASQVKLLRLLQEGEYFPLGSDRPKRLKARIVVATHCDLVEREAQGSFRRDLYYRLRTHRIHVPPLRERKGDIPLLLDYFLAEAARDLDKKKPTPPRELTQLLSTYAFPGNVRELRSMVYDAVSVHRDRILSMESFIQAIGPEGRPPVVCRACAPASGPAG